MNSVKSTERTIIDWENNGRPVPPPHIVKQRTLRRFAQRFGIKILVETGTCRGHMVEAMKDVFDQVFSIELGRDLYEKAKKKFEAVPNVEIIHGDSGVELGNLIKMIDQPILFWLDAHYSMGVTARGDIDTPILEELEHILSAKKNENVIIIDDARDFGSSPDYPSIEELSSFVKSREPGADIAIKDDSIRITFRSVPRG